MTESPREPKVHTFGDTFQAYNATQCQEDIRDGDVLLVESEKVVGIAWTWPFALTESIGELHVMTADPRTHQDGMFAAGVALAEQVAREHGLRIVPPLDKAKARAILAGYQRDGEPVGYRVLTRKTETGRERTGWLVASTTAFIELDTFGHLAVTGTWTRLTNEKQES
ncbi:hypothetical protein [Streptomyces malaysiensis]|uniref:Uncharacterized protein n=1 Tax=Streptomyces malaysiensis TaxID=92644 RepID=A0A7X5X935_STRMQ|nr:hypothetical protein [Streptomyces malaysiensis]NIY68095.1 hypothetical protein [Streptomyces malaysiensis]